MAYSTSTLARVGGANSDAGSIWMYKTADALATVLAADYFSDGFDRGMKADDSILITDTNLNQNVLCYMSTVTSGGAATASNPNASNSEIVTTTNVITASESGKTFYLNLAGGFTSTLPAPFLGGKFKFVVSTAPTTAYIIVTTSGADIMIGGINELEVDTGDDGPYDANADTLNFVASTAVVGDYVIFESDGTSWFYYGQTNADGGITTSTT